MNWKEMATWCFGFATFGACVFGVVGCTKEQDQRKAEVMKAYYEATRGIVPPDEFSPMACP